MKKIFLLVFSILSINCIAQNISVNAIYTSPEADILPSFSDDPYYLNQFIQSNFIVNSLMKSVPNYSFDNFTISFRIDTSGFVSDVSFFSSKNVYVEKELSRIINIMPKWKPAFKNGFPITTITYLPLSYTIKDNFFEIINTSSKTLKVTKKTNTLIKFTIVGACIAIMWICLFNR